MTYSMVARCPRTGQFGIGVASFSMAIGRHCDGAVRSNVGVALTQGFPNPRNNYLAINLLGQGHTASQALATLIANDARGDYRQSGQGYFGQYNAVVARGHQPQFYIHRSDFLRCHHNISWRGENMHDRQ